ncbi:MAG: DUF427 domain-containing protein [Bacteroidota bacterium]
MQVESVWDYPRPPRLEVFSGHIRIVHQDIILVDTNQALRILETSHPPTYYLPKADIQMQYLVENPRQSFCEFKGRASYYDLKMGEEMISQLAWYYPTPNQKYAQLQDHLCFYASKLDTCYVNDEKVQAQAGDFYGGWITANIKGPFKGGPGTFGW